MSRPLEPWCILISRPRLIHSLSMLLVVSVRVLMDYKVPDKPWQVWSQTISSRTSNLQGWHGHVFFGLLENWKARLCNEHGLAWYLPLAWYALIVVVFSCRPNAQAPNNPSRGEANGRCDITPNVSGRYFEFTDFRRQAKCMLFYQSVGGCDDCVFSQIYLVYLSCCQQHASHKMIQMFPFKRVLC